MHKSKFPSHCHLGLSVTGIISFAFEVCLAWLTKIAKGFSYHSSTDGRKSLVFFILLPSVRFFLIILTSNGLPSYTIKHVTAPFGGKCFRAPSMLCQRGQSSSQLAAFPLNSSFFVHLHSKRHTQSRFQAETTELCQ